ncbi:hypothetical protein TRFO_08868 [Tritrichomonas foetus]|uniref:Uncharacterized protein n=1 Tax=Tritrichomonas foetus TaxID=1144522 RepID=A0A1J4JHG2_9EUKA|nr:hypothetical protein TRFO_08868 [Tritrichomonas foetus]|eukprot:OHS98574.1 hypothetical protein TRFO_08868 [Tritrichomonas foetus]
MLAEDGSRLSILDNYHTQLKQNDEVNDITFSDDQIMLFIENLFNSQNWQQSIDPLMHFSINKYLNSSQIRKLRDLLLLFGQALKNQVSFDPAYINALTMVLHNFCDDDYKLVTKLVDSNIHTIFYQFLNLEHTLILYQVFLDLDHAPNDLDHNIKELDHDLKQVQYEEICIKEGYNKVAHYLVDNGVASKFLEMLNSDISYKNVILDTIGSFGYYFFSYESFSPLIDRLFEIVFNDPTIEFKCSAAKAIAKFVGSSRPCLNHILSFTEFLNFLVNPPFDQYQLLKAIMLFAERAISLIHYLSHELILMLLNFAITLMKSDSYEKYEVLLDSAFEIIAQGTKSGSQFVNFCMQQGIVQQIFIIFENGIPFKVQQSAFVTICDLFSVANVDVAKQMVALGFFFIISEYTQPITSNAKNIMMHVLDALNHALDLSETYEELAEWKSQILDDEKIIDPISELDCGKGNTGDYLQESVEVYAHSFLLNLYE